MRIDRLYHPVTTLGPGARVAVWASGCSKHCPGCANPELWGPRPEADLPPARVAAILNELAARTGCHRITFTGGDPLEQASELAQVLEAIRPAFDDILVYTGFTLEELRRDPRIPRTLLAEDPAAANTLPAAAAPSPASTPPPVADEQAPTHHGLIDVLIDGPYVAALNDGACGLRGSTNQRVIVLNPALETLYHDEERKPRRVQNAVFDGRALSIGIHGRPSGEEPL
ncbi:4Fe-4S single cluster domain-containing protein [Adlercreutzia sp. R25]|uniref:4Fe-4S single cluster domain-containing protein n=1 Tax=Adlercreutzia shanghongiae TaxID=3111773 RepID=UPI002DB85C4E|nr:4Fe-4S single cluster domain-containing protein [Adlercreutzia sp. R25]MEC4272880.1 4Fe-4S single cluster domain-containing protein [Adlercreutzia sp. R25]